MKTIKWGEYAKNTRCAIVNPLDEAIDNATDAWKKLDYMFACTFKWEVEGIYHIKQDLADAIEVMRKVRKIVNDYYKNDPTRQW